ALAVGNIEAVLAVGVQDQVHAVGLAGHDFERAGGRRAVAVGAGVVAHGEVVGIVPQGAEGVAVVIAHDLALGAERAAAAGRAVTGVEREQIGRTVVLGLLFRGVAVVLVGGGDLRHVETERVGRAGAVRRVGEVRVVGQQAGGVDGVVVGLRVLLGVEGRLADRVGRVGIGAEIMVERDVLAIDDDQV